MKKVSIISIALLLIAVIFLAFNQTDQDKSLARAHRVQGKYVFVMCEPVNDYEIVKQVNTRMSYRITIKPSSEYSFDMEMIFTMEGMIEDIIERLIIMERENKIGEFDGLIIGKGETGTLIKFIE